ncbi:pancreatic lipase-related protein 2-like [Coccinella septempunctata]|uniref:pancreatic lipase-related protein 2-like n=1 Tax=Coccinella septempunctata TaxID=41139 RepID=UPI001D08A9FD|nr:pancreatic lipase-related protein 2-like [Coccinella septempunctata]
MREYSNFCIILSSFIAVVVYTQDVYNMSGVQLIQLLGEVIQVREGDVRDADVSFYLSTRKNSKAPKLIERENNKEIDVRKPTKFIIHGWIENYKVGWYEDMKNELLKYEDVNVIYVDWERVAKSYYISSAKNTKLVGDLIGRFTVENRFPPENVHLIGHSLGSHVAGFASKYFKRSTGSRIKRISALDAAGPYFRLPDISENEKLSRDDAEIVDAMHTDARFLGMESPVGTLDIYVNGGSRRQPGCNDGGLSLELHEVLKNNLCSHARSHQYFIQSINNADIVCKKCSSYEGLKNNDCSESDVYRIVHQNITSDMKGICAAFTSTSPPYFV